MYLRGMPKSVGPSTFIEVGRGRDWDMARLSLRLDIVPLGFERWYMAKAAARLAGGESGF